MGLTRWPRTCGILSLLASALFGLGAVHPLLADEPAANPQSNKTQQDQAALEINVQLANARDAFAAGKQAEAVAIWTTLAEKNEPRAQFNLALAIQAGLGAEQNAATAAAWFRKAAEQKIAPAEFELGLAYFTASGVEDDPKQGLEWIKKAAEQGFGPAQSYLAFAYELGLILPRDQNLAAKYYEMAAKNGVAEAQVSLAGILGNGTGVAKDPAAAAHWYRLAADQGRADAMHNLGVLFERGEGLKEDYAEAARWYTKSAERCFPFAAFRLAQCYVKGQGVERDAQWAAWWLRFAGDVPLEAEEELTAGSWFESGDFLPRDLSLAKDWYERAANHVQFSKAPNIVARTEEALARVVKQLEESPPAPRDAAAEEAEYQRGLAAFSKKEYAAAITVWVPLAMQGNARSQSRLGHMYELGAGVPQDDLRALQWYHLAAAQDEPGALLQLASCYEHGRGVIRDLAEAESYFEKTAKRLPEGATRQKVLREVERIRALRVQEKMLEPEAP